MANSVPGLVYFQPSVLKIGFNNTTFLWSGNVNTEIAVPFVDTVDFDTGGYNPTSGPDQFIIPEDGIYEFLGYYSWQETTVSNNARAVIRLVLKANGVNISPQYQNNYIRDASGNNEAGQSIVLTQQLSAGDVITLHKTRIAGPGGVGGLRTVANSNSFLSVMRIA